MHQGQHIRCLLLWLPPQQRRIQALVEACCTGGSLRLLNQPVDGRLGIAPGWLLRRWAARCAGACQARASVSSLCLCRLHLQLQVGEGSGGGCLLPIYSGL